MYLIIIQVKLNPTPIVSAAACLFIILLKLNIFNLFKSCKIVNGRTITVPKTDPSCNPFLI